jgi:hypothetical protein
MAAPQINAAKQRRALRDAALGDIDVGANVSVSGNAQR